MSTNKEILVVDDSVTNVFLLESVLKEYGYSVSTALNARDAQKKIGIKKPDLILLDLLMPQIDGFGFIKELKETPAHSDIPVIVVSAVTEQESIQKILSMGAVEYIRKPVVLTSLIEKIEKVFK